MHVLPRRPFAALEPARSVADPPGWGTARRASGGLVPPEPAKARGRRCPLGSRGGRRVPGGCAREMVYPPHSWLGVRALTLYSVGALVKRYAARAGARSVGTPSAERGRSLDRMKAACGVPSTSRITQARGCSDVTSNAGGNMDEIKLTIRGQEYRGTYSVDSQRIGPVVKVSYKGREITSPIGGEGTGPDNRDPDELPDAEVASMAAQLLAKLILQDADQGSA
jgi:hypothetical protein